MTHIATLTTCHNRRALTLASLANLKNQDLTPEVELSYFIVDDGSTDGTAAEIAERFPDVQVITGNGVLYWAGGMRLGWETEIRQLAPDFLFVYNDDVRLYSSALGRLLKVGSTFENAEGHSRYAVVGSFSDRFGKTSYGGVVRGSTWHPYRFNRLDPPESGFIEADTVNMNACLIAKGALDAIGFLDSHYVHSGADFDFGLRLKKAGGHILVAAGYVGQCERNREKKSAINSFQGVSLRYREMIGPKGEPLKQHLYFCRKHGGLLWPIWFLARYLKPLVQFARWWARREPADL